MLTHDTCMLALLTSPTFRVLAVRYRDVQTSTPHIEYRFYALKVVVKYNSKVKLLVLRCSCGGGDLTNAFLATQ